LDGPATRPMTPLAVENSVGKPAAPARDERLMPVLGKRASESGRPRGSGRPGENFQNVGDAKNGTAGL
jgi:hypothetical protein